jgi:hypothetical protein
VAKLIFGIRIELSKSAVNSEVIGLYPKGVRSVFRWSNDTALTTDAYKVGILNQQFLTPIGYNADIRTGGNLAQVQSFRISLDNTSKIWDTIETKGINFQGARCIVYLIDNEIDDNDNYENEFSIGRGECAQVSYSVDSFEIEVNSIYTKRNAICGKIIDADYAVDEEGISLVDEDSIGKMIPITFGTHERALYRKVTGRNNKILDFSDYVLPTSTRLPVVVNSSDYNRIDVGIGNGFSDQAGLESYLNDLITAKALYFRIIEGKGSGELRRVVGKTITSTFIPPLHRLRIDIEEPFSETETYGNPEASWGSFVDIRWGYLSDDWLLQPTLNVFPQVIDNGFYRPVAESSGQFEQDDSNAIKFYPRNPLDDPDQIQGWNSIAVDSFEAVQDHTWIDDSTGILTDIADCNYIEDVNTADEWIPSSPNYSTSITGFDTGDGLLNNGLIVTNDTGTFDNAFYTVYKIKLPKIESKADISKVLLCLYGNIDSIMPDPFRFLDIEFKLFKKDFLDNLVQIGTTSTAVSVGKQGLGERVEYRIFPDWKSIDDDQFWRKPELDVINAFGINSVFVGQFYEFEENFEEYLALDEIAFVIKRKEGLSFGNISVGQALNLNDLFIGCSVAYQITDEIGSEVFGASSGRSQNSTTQTPWINVLNTLTTINRLQNWTDAGLAVPTGGWGLEAVASGELIDTTTGEGGKANPDLNSFGYSGLDCSRQILELRDSETIEMKRSIMRQYSLMGWINNEGYESICQISRQTKASITRQILRSDIIGEIDVSDRKSNEIYCQPTFFYDRDYGLDKWNGTMGVRDITQAQSTDADKIAQVFGKLTNSQKLDIWERCRALYLEYKVINKVPADLSELSWVRKPATAYKLMVMMLENQGAIKDSNGDYPIEKRQFYEFSIPLEKSYDLGLMMGSRFYLNDPFYTDGDLECLVHGISYDPVSMAVNIKALGYVDADVFNPAWQNTNDETNDNYQNTNDDTNDNYQNTNTGF